MDCVEFKYFTHSLHSLVNYFFNTQREIGPFDDPVTWYGINYVGAQVTQWNCLTV